MQVASLGRCKTCQHPVSEEARMCPSCGQPAPFDFSPQGTLGPLPEIGRTYSGTVTRIMDFGVFVRLSPGVREGLVHISQLSKTRVENVTDKVSEGDRVTVKVLEVDQMGRIRLTMVL